MKRNRIALLLVCLLLITTLTGCTGKEVLISEAADVQQTAIHTLVPVTAPTATPAVPEEEQVQNIPPEGEPVQSAVPEMTAQLTDIQRNSIAMLNYVAVLTQEINASQNSRLYLEEAYSNLVNSVYPNAVDSRTLSQFYSILDTLEKYRMAAVKRERLNYIYEQNRAQAVCAALTDPLSLMDTVRSADLRQLADSVLYMAVDAAASYISMTTQMDYEYLQDGWSLNDEAAKALHESRKSAFGYMVQEVQEYNLPGDLALNENMVEQFVEWENNSNVVQRIQFLEANADAYQALGRYWLVLAKSYYEHGDYQKCLDAVADYESLGIRIFRKDYDYAQVLPLAILSAEAVLTKDAYVEAAEEYVKKILENTDYDDWVSRYFAAQTDIDLYARTEDPIYLQSAYQIALDNANSLISEQKSLNAEYLAPIAKAEIPDDAAKEEKQEIKQYNKMLQQVRKTALPPVYEPLALNCELLFSLADALEISSADRQQIEDLLHENGGDIFLTAPMDAQFRMAEKAEPETAAVQYEKKRLTLPASLVWDGAHIAVSVVRPETGETTQFEDWEIRKVERAQEGDLGTFRAVYASAESQAFAYKAGDEVTVSVVSGYGENAQPISFRFVCEEQSFLWVFDGTPVFREIAE